MPWTKTKWAGVWAIAALLACLAGAGCVSSATIARHALEAPNRQSNDEKVFKRFAFVTTNFPVARGSVGPPAAALEVMMIEPGDYGVIMTSSITPRHVVSKGDTQTNMFTFAF